MQGKLTLDELKVEGQKVLVRVDFNVPLNDAGEIVDDMRIQSSLPTIEELLKRGAAVILMSHMGRPKKPNPRDSLAICAKRLSALLKKPVEFATDCIGKEAQSRAEVLQPGQILLLENLRFYPAEEHPQEDPSFAKKLASLGDCYVNDAFATAHRAHSSTATIASYFPHKAAAGLLMQKEIESLTPLIAHPKKPSCALIGGAKVSTKIGLLKSLLGKVDTLFIGGGMLFTFLKAQGHPIGSSLCDEEYLDTALQFLELARTSSTEVVLPLDTLVADRIAPDAKTQILESDDPIPNGWQGVDIGPKTLANWKEKLSFVKTLFWNGPMGVVEIEPFSHGTQKLAQIIASLDAFTVIGGGDSVAVINQMGIAPLFSHVSTGGGASLEFIEYGHLPGIDALSDA